MRSVVITVLCVGLMFVPEASPSQESAPAQQVILQKRAESMLRRAAECFSDSKCDHKKALDEAALLYSEMAKMLTGKQRTSANIAMVANGFLKSGRAADAIDLLRRERDNLNDGNLQHLLADSLYVAGDYRNAAIEYQNWIAGGCVGYLWSFDDTGLWSVKRHIHRCSSLPAELRARLEALRAVAGGQPTNLPDHNDAAIRASIH